jgi:1,4-alpha-glucan branching enzyme
MTAIVEQYTKLSAKKPAKIPVAFALHAPHAKNVYVAGEFTNWIAKAVPLHRKRDGTWFTQVLLKPGRYQYKLVVDDQWQNDPAAVETVPDGFGGTNDVVEVKGRAS